MPRTKTATKPAGGSKPYSIRLSQDEHALIERAASELGQSSATAYVKAVALQAARGQDMAHELRAIEERIAATLGVLGKRIRVIENENQILISMLDNFIKVFLTCVPEPTAESINAARAHGKARYGKFSGAVKADMTGDVLAILQQLKSENGE